MEILVMGAGAVGSFLGWAAATGGAHVTLVRRSRVGPPTDERLTVTRPSGELSTTTVAVAGSVAEIAGPPDLVALAVKQFDVAAALEALGVWPSVPVLTVQNGIGAEEATARARPVAPLLAASVTAPVERDRAGMIHWLRPGGVALAPVQDDTALLASLETLVRSADVPVGLFDDARAMKWSKLLGNLVANASSGLLDMDPAAIYADAGLFEIERDQLRETLAVMAALHLPIVDLPGSRMRLLALGIRLPRPVGRLVLSRVVGGARGGKDPSLRPALAAGGPTEVRWLNGAVAQAAADHGLAAPVNAGLAALVEAAGEDPDRRAWFRNRPDRLLEALGRS
jgi:2-dehydropantoate 2-reductase